MVTTEYVKLATEVVRQAKNDLTSSNRNRRKSAERYFKSEESSYPFSFRFIKNYLEEMVAPHTDAVLKKQGSLHRAHT